ncbi:MAG: hypothetical protein JRN32_02140 [Nitrososphaerota archaeon]|jgi:hypothetical protein|nr:hypothetical protein [Nitrososphaerota archaeon]MDG7043108.1 hypothetical protein [Nitrososphaerota archaeon]MDG7045601.1 hypothetical protein [Nitrososphaerota archaeon]
MSDEGEWNEETIDFLKHIKADLEELRREMVEATKAVHDAMDFLTASDIFQKDADFIMHLTAVQFTLVPYVEHQMALERERSNSMGAMMMQGLMPQAPEPSQKAQPSQPEETHQSDTSWLSRIAGALRHRTSVPLASPELGNAIDVQEKIAWIRQQYECHVEYLKIHDIEGGTVRQKLLTHWRNYLSFTFAEASNYVQASYRDEEQAYRALREGLLRVMVGAETTPHGGENKQ